MCTCWPIRRCQRSLRVWWGHCWWPYSPPAATPTYCRTNGSRRRPSGGEPRRDRLERETWWQSTECHRLTWTDRDHSLYHTASPVHHQSIYQSINQSICILIDWSISHQNQIKSNVSLIQQLSNRSCTVQDRIKQYSQRLSQNTIKLQSVRCDMQLPIM